MQRGTATGPDAATTRSAVTIFGIVSRGTGCLSLPCEMQLNHGWPGKKLD